ILDFPIDGDGHLAYQGIGRVDDVGNVDGFILPDFGGVERSGNDRVIMKNRSVPLICPIV
ncbi:MAG: hypothetical protein IJI45_03365, partial [Anaerolineaceae bacterium]|nr:hypothetical protein [Anaerolineaceae bacterium]